MSSMRSSVNSQFQKLPEIPEDIRVEVLSRLPVKSLLRFKSVCKTWYNLIKTPSFVSMHHNLRNVSHLLICTRTFNQTRYNHVFSIRSNDISAARVLSPDFKIPTSCGHDVFVVGSCNGIVCFYDTWLSKIFLSNPVTREFKQLPPATSIRWNEQTLVVGLGFDSQNIYDFKVLRVVGSIRVRKTYRAEMYTLSSNTWRLIECGLDERLQVQDNSHRGVFFANSFHFNAITSSKKYSIVCCDINTERFKRMDLPKIDYCVMKMWLTSLMVVHEFLSAVFTYTLQYDDERIDIWIMKDHGVVESWTKLYRIGSYIRFSDISCFWMDDHALLLFRNASGAVVRCYPIIGDNLNKLDVNLENMVFCGGRNNSQVVVVKETLVSIM